MTLRSPVEQPPAEQSWAREAIDWYESLSSSGQSRYFEPSDWQLARILARLLSDTLQSARPSAEVIKTILAHTARLGTTEADRRRMSIEVTRAIDAADDDAEAEDAVVAQLRAIQGGA